MIHIVQIHLLETAQRLHSLAYARYCIHHILLIFSTTEDAGNKDRAGFIARAKQSCGSVRNV